MQMQYHATMGVLTFLIVTVPATLGKIFKQSPTGLEKTTAGDFCQGKFVVKFFTTVWDLVALLKSVTTSAAITASVPVTGALEGAIVTKAMLAQFPDALTRTKKHFAFLFGQKGIIILDYDPPAGKEALNRDQLWNLLVATIPELRSAGVVWWCSGSSHIYSGDVEMQGLRGQRLYIMVDDISDTERVCDILAKRLWAAGHGYIAISKSGKGLPFQAKDVLQLWDLGEHRSSDDPTGMVAYCSELARKVYRDIGLTNSGIVNKSIIAPAHFDQLADNHPGWLDITETVRPAIEFCQAYPELVRMTAKLFIAGLRLNRQRFDDRTKELTAIQALAKIGRITKEQAKAATAEIREIERNMHHTFWDVKRRE